MSDEPSPPLRLKPRTPPATPPGAASAEAGPPSPADAPARPARPSLRLAERPADAPAADASTADTPADIADTAAPASPPFPAGNAPADADAAPVTPPATPDSTTGDEGRLTLLKSGDPGADAPPLLHIGLKGEAEAEISLEPPPLPPPGDAAAPVLRPDIALPAVSAASTAHRASAPPVVAPGAKPERRRSFRLGVYAVVVVLLALVGVGAGAFFRAVKRATEEKRGQVRATPAPQPTSPPAPSAAPSANQGALSGAIAKAAAEVRKADARKDAVEGVLAPTTPPRPTPEEDLSRFPSPRGRAAVAEAGASRAFVAFVESTRISGVFEGTPARALINGRTVRAGTVVDASLGVVFVGLDAGARQLVFRDATGAVVRKPY